VSDTTDIYFCIQAQIVCIYSPGLLYWERTITRW